MLLISIAIAWTGLILVLLSILRMAALSDRQRARAEAFEPPDWLESQLRLDERSLRLEERSGARNLR